MKNSVKYFWLLLFAGIAGIFISIPFSLHDGDMESRQLQNTSKKSIIDVENISRISVPDRMKSIQAEEIEQSQSELVDEILLIQKYPALAPSLIPDNYKYQARVPDHQPESKKEAKSPSTYLSIVFDNDIWDNTDYYYTNGIDISLTLPAAAFFPTAYLLPGHHHSHLDYYGFRIVQNIYTPVDPDQYEVQYGDRPFAAYLYLGHFRSNTNLLKRSRHSSELDIGIMGPAAMGGFVQKTIHTIEPVGWQNQVENDLVLNYSYQYEKSIVSMGSFHLSGNAGGQLGTLYNNLDLGFRLQAGNTGPYLSYLNLANGQKKFSFNIYVTADNKLNIYDATLQGGLFNNTSVYTLSASDISRYVFTGSAGFAVGYGILSLEAEQFYLTPEFKNGRHHMWGRIKLIIGI